MSTDADSWLTGLTDDKSPLPDVRERAHREAVRECRVETREEELDRKQLTKMQRHLASSAAGEKCKPQSLLSSNVAIFPVGCT